MGTGGAAAGEPVSTDATLLPTVRSTPFATPSLELQDTVDFGARFVRFTFAPEIDYTTGIVTMQMDLWFKEMDDQPHDVDASLGVGALIIGMSHDSDLDGLLYLDNVMVTASVPTAVSSASMGEVKSLYSGSKR